MSRLHSIITVVFAVALLAGCASASRPPYHAQDPRWSQNTTTCAESERAHIGSEVANMFMWSAAMVTAVTAPVMAVAAFPVAGIMAAGEREASEDVRDCLAGNERNPR